MTARSENRLRAQKNFQDFCHLPNLLLSSIAYDIRTQPRPLWSTALRKCYFLIICCANVYVCIFIGQLLYSLITSDTFQASLFLRVMSGFSYAVFSIAKCVSFLLNRKWCRLIFETLNEIYPKTTQEKVTYKVWKYFWPKWILFVVYFYLGCVLFICFSPLLESIILYVVGAARVGWRSAEFGYHKIYEVEYSFGQPSLLSYCLAYTIEVMHGQFVIVFNICGDIWLLCFALQLCMHFEHLAHTLENYQPNTLNFNKDQEFIAGFVERHQIILNVGAGLTRVFSSTLLLMLMSTASILCCTGAYILTQGFGREMIEFAAFLPFVIGQYYLICYYGQLLLIRSRNVAEAAYKNSWYNGSQSYKKSILIILMRSQQEVVLNALGFQNIGLEAFQMLMGATYRVFTLLKETLL